MLSWGIIYQPWKSEKHLLSVFYLVSALLGMELEVLGMRCRILQLSSSPAPSSLSSSVCDRTLESGTVGWAHLCLWICTCLCPPPVSAKILGWCHAGSQDAHAVYHLTTSLSFVMLMGSPLDRGNRGSLCLDAGVVVPVGVHESPLQRCLLFSACMRLLLWLCFLGSNS